METPEQKRIRRNGYSAAWRKKSPEQSSAAHIRYRKAHPDRILDAVTKSRFGILRAEYDSRLASQNNLCAMCHKPFDISMELLKPVLDHCHRTGQLREFLHRGCNLAVEHLQESAGHARLAVAYLERHHES
jgi:hypothetical protein